MNRYRIAMSRTLFSGKHLAVSDFSLSELADNHRLAAFQALNKVAWGSQAEWEQSGGVWFHVALDEPDNTHTTGMPISVHAIHLVPTIANELEYQRKG